MRIQLQASRDAGKESPDWNVWLPIQRNISILFYFKLFHKIEYFDLQCCLSFLL